MAIVANLALEGAPNPGGTANTDPSLVGPSVEYAGDPNGNLTPTFAGQICLDTTDNMLWKSMDASDNSWVPLTSSGGTL